MNIISILFSNILGFDGIIFLFAIGTGLVWRYAKRSADDFYKKMHPTSYAPDFDHTHEEISREVEEMTETRILEMRIRTNKVYTIFVNLVAIFPLLGILGTVLSLVMLASEAGLSDITDKFFIALTSTFWGIIFSIVFKVCDALISPKIEENERSAEAFMDRLRRSDRVSR